MKLEKKTKVKLESWTVRFHPENLERLRELAEKSGHTMNGLIEVAVMNFLKEVRKEYGLKK